MLEQGLAYHCYMCMAELDALRERQMAAKEKPRYDGTWRPEPGKTLPPVPDGVQPVIRFRNPLGGAVAWDDKVKGRIEIGNDELDDLVIARPDGTPTYNFCVVVDDIDMAITHVIRGDDHVNNTPRQINILRALGATPPVYAHLPTVLNEQGEKMSKRHGAKPVMQYREEGYLRRCDGELPGAPGLEPWRRRDLLARAVRAVVRPGPPGQERRRSSTRRSCAGSMRSTSSDARRRCSRRSSPSSSHGRPCSELDDAPGAAIALYKDRCSTTRELADWLAMYFAPVQPSEADLAAHVTPAVEPALAMLRDKLERRRVGPGRDPAGGEGRRWPRRASRCRNSRWRARAGLRPIADAIARRGARAVPAGDRAGAIARRLKSWL